jgi:osmoprotectant transport system permease protein
VNFSYLFDNWRRVLSLTQDHLTITLLAIGLALLAAIPLGLLASRVPKLALPILSLLGAIYTVPSLAFLAFLIPSLGLGRKPAIVVLAAYAQISLVRNIVAGLQSVDRSTLEAARGVGMTRSQVALKVEFPLALPIFIAGLRIATVTTIALATVTAWVNAGGLGTLLFDGISRDYPSEILAGAVAIVALALITDGLLRMLERITPATRARRARANGL